MHLRSGPTTKSSILATIPYGKKVQVDSQPVTGEQDEDWYRVKYDSKSGYVLGTLLSRKIPPVRLYVDTKGCAGLNLHTEPGTDAKVLAVIPGGAPITTDANLVKGDDGSKWYKATYNGHTGYVYAPLVSKTKPEPQGRSLHLPVLMYHRIGDPSSRYQVSPSEFAEQLDWLKNNGYTTVTLNQVYNYMFCGGSLPQKPVMLTFDDGYANQWTAVLAMNARDMKGVFFIMGQGNQLSDAQIRQMIAWGHEIESHTMTHPFLTHLSDSQLRYQLVESKSLLEQRYGIQINFLAYPSGDYNERVAEAVQAAGYRGGIHAWGNSTWSPAKRWYEPRIEIDGGISLHQFINYVTQY